MTGRALKRLIAKIPDNAKVLVLGVDCGGYDAVTCPKAKVEWNEDEKAWVVEGVEPKD